MTPLRFLSSVTRHHLYQPCPRDPLADTIRVQVKVHAANTSVRLKPFPNTSINTGVPPPPLLGSKVGSHVPPAQLPLQHSGSLEQEFPIAYTLTLATAATTATAKSMVCPRTAWHIGTAIWRRNPNSPICYGLLPMIRRTGYCKEFWVTSLKLRIAATKSLSIHRLLGAGWVKGYMVSFPF